MIYSVRQTEWECREDEPEALDLLDTYTMTALRPDGHLRPPTDCLHYQLPSVVDWWHHLLATLLADATHKHPREKRLE